MKKIILLPLAAATFVAPVAVASQCGSKSTGANKVSVKTAKDETIKKYEQMELKDLPKDGVVWDKGITYFASNHATSFLFNLCEKLGWQSAKDTDLTLPSVSTSNNVAGYTSGKTSATQLEQSLQKDMNFLSSQLPSDSLFGLISSIIQFASTSATAPIVENNHIFDSRLINVNNPLIPATDANIIGASNHLAIKLDSGMDNAGQLAVDAGNIGTSNIIKVVEALESVKNNDAFAKDAMFSKNILFTLDEASNTLHLWTKITQDNIDKLKSSANALLAPHALPNADVSKKPLSATKNISFEPAGHYTTVDDQWDILRDFDWSSFGNRATKNTYDKFGRFSKYSSFIDGEHPGVLKIKLWLEEKNSGSQIVHTYTSHENNYPIFEKLSTSESTRLSDMMWQMIYNMKNNLGGSLSLLEAAGLNDDFNNMLRFLVNTNFTKAQFNKAFESLNNGSHYFPAIELFMRGVKSLPRELWVTNPDSKGPDIMQGFARGMVSANDFMNMMNYIYDDDSIHYNSLSGVNEPK